MPTMTYQVNELFDSIQGEGRWSGTAATFIRLQGCTVGCPWCDSGPDADKIWGRHTNGLTRNTWGKGGERMSVAEILGFVHRRHVVITGGEPTLYNLDPLIQMIMSKHYIQLETSGQQWLKGVCCRPDWITWSPKQALNWDASDMFYVHANEIKFVVEPALPLEVISRVVSKAHMSGNRNVLVVLMPEGCPPGKENIDLAIHYQDCLERAGIRPVMFGDRLQYRLGIR